MRLAQMLVLGGVGLALSASSARPADPGVGLPCQPCPTYRPSPYGGSYPQPSYMPLPSSLPQVVPPTTEPAPEPGNKEPGKKEPTAAGAGAGAGAGEPSAQAPQTDAFAQAPQAGTEAASSFAPNMYGDLLASQICGPLIAYLPASVGGGVLVLQRGVAVPSIAVTPGTRYNFDFTISHPNGSVTVVPAGQPLPAGISPGASLPPAINCNAGTVALVAHGAFKITENESPRPQDRVFGTYNFYGNVGSSENPPDFPQSDVHREVIGFEKTFLDGDASFGIRLPFIQRTGDRSFSESDVGDLTFILKYAFLNDRETGNVLSGGLAITAPTGADFIPDGSIPVTIHSTLLQPYAGAILNLGPMYVQGFTSIVVPTDSRDVLFLSNDIGIGWFLYRNRDALLSAVVPIFEVHVITPLDHRGSLAMPIGIPDIVDLTAGITLGFARTCSLNLGVNTPVTGPKPYEAEALAQLNIGF